MQTVSVPQYNKAVQQLRALNAQVTKNNQILAQEARTIRELEAQTAAKPTGTPAPTATKPTATLTPTTTQSGAHVVSTHLEYARNCYSCLYLYERVDTYSNGTTTRTPVIKQLNACAGLPVVYVGLVYLSNKNSTYYKYAVYAYLSNGTRKQIATYVHQGPVTKFVCKV